MTFSWSQRALGGRVPAHAHPFDVGRHEADGLADPLRRAFVAHDVARPVDEIEHLTRVGQRDDKRVIAPNPLVGHVHAVLLVAQRRVVAQAAQVLQPRASAQQVVGDVQHMVRLVVRQVPLQQRQPPVDLPGQPELRHQLPDHADAPVAHRVDPRPDLVADPARPEHRARPGGPRPPRPGVPRLHLPPAPGTVPSALSVRYCLHRKGLLVEIRRLSP